MNTDIQKPQLDLPGDNGRGPSAETSPSLPARDRNSRDRSVSPHGPQPPLPPLPNAQGDDAASTRTIRPTIQSNLQAKATTAVSLADIGSQSHEESSKESYAASAIRSLPGLRAKASLGQLVSPKGSEAGDTASIRSSIPNAETAEMEALFGDFAASERGSIATDATGLLQFPEFQAGEVDDDFASEFEPVGEVDEYGENEGSWSL